MLVRKSHAIARMRGTNSGLLVDGDAVGETFYGGSGAGSLPTASGVVADMIDVATGSALCTFRQLRIFNDRSPAASYVDPDEMVNSFFVRLDIDPAFAAPQEAQRAWQDSPVPLSVVRAFERTQSIVVITEPMSEKRFRGALQYLASALHPVGQPVVLRVLDAR